MLLKLLNLFALLRLVSSQSTVELSVQDRAVSLLFQNDADWEHFANHSSALLFHQPANQSEAVDVCKAQNETLFDIGHLDEIINEFSYFKFLGDVKTDDKFWVTSSTGACSVAPLSGNTTCVATSEEEALAFLCTNSAPHTDKVDTDFSNSPKTLVESNGTVFTGTRDHLTFRFTGIPYAQPPTGTLRFQYPQKWTGDSVNATALKPGCPQFNSAFADNSMGLNPWGISEDCLFLNVYTPFVPPKSNTTKSRALRPVLFWIHGGGNMNGLSSDPTFDGGPLASRTDSVIVTINYRLNIFGFLALNDGVINGNYHLADKIAALQWVKDNIAAFGGDASNVMIFGQSAGGGAIIDLLRSPPAKGLFASAISQSGGSGSAQTVAQADATNAPVLARLGCNSTGTERLECLQALPVDVLTNVTGIVGGWSSVIDDVFVVDAPLDQFSQGPDAINSVPFMTGFMLEEAQSLLQETIAPNDTDFNATLTRAVGSALAKKVIASGLWNVTDERTPYNATIQVSTDRFTCSGEQLVTTAAKSSAFPSLRVYATKRAYGLNYFDPYGLCTFPVGDPQPYYRCHSGDLYEVFGTYHIFAQPVRVKEDIFYTALAQDLWSSFAKTGDPNPDKEYLRARGDAYKSTLDFLEQSGWVWPVFGGDDGTEELVASLDYPAGIDDGMPDEKNGRCAVVTGN